MIIQLDNKRFKKNIRNRVARRYLAQRPAIMETPDLWEFNADMYERVEKYLIYAIKHYGVWYDRSLKRNPIEKEKEFEDVMAVLSLLVFITPRQLLQWFPPKKIYDGAKWEAKDYYSTMKACEAWGLDNPISEGFSFLWDYMSTDIMLFMVTAMHYMERKNIQKNGISMIDELMSGRFK